MNERDHMDEQGADDDMENSVINSSPPALIEPSIIRHNDEGGGKVPLWLITFTDVMALMLTFFVLLYAMSSP